jgi:branched-chain amino acid transport system permease protein
MTVSIVNGLFVGAIYGVFAVGLVLIYQVSRTINFAAANIGMLGALVFTQLRNVDGWPVMLAVVAGTALAGVLAGAGNLAIARPLQNKHPIAATLATFGFATLLYSYAAQRYGTQPIASATVWNGRGFELLGYRFSPDQLLIIALGVATVGGVLLTLRKTTLGLRIRATAIDAQAASQAGIRTDRVSLVVWILAGAATGLGAILVSSQVSLTVDFTSALMLRALTAALFGGLTSVGGAFVGGIILGVVEAAINFQVTTPGIPEVIFALVVIGILVIRPTGLRAAEY